MSKVVVLGAGVSGLTSALTLLRLFKNEIQELTLLGSEYPGDAHTGDYTSPWAGADWHSFAKNDELEQIERDSYTYKKLLQLADEEHTAGIQRFTIKSFFSVDEPIPWFIEQNFVEDIVQISEAELIERKLDPATHVGFNFTTVSITPVVYNSFLLTNIKQRGGKCRKIKRLDVIEDVVDIVGYVPDLLINCTGVNAGKLLRTLDPSELKKVYPVKGQILQLYEDLPFQVIIDKLPLEDKPQECQFLNAFPRQEGGCIIGGTFLKGDWSSTVDEELSASILRVAQNHIPELKSTTVYNSYTALRPGREGGVRIGLSEYYLPKQKSALKVVHNYGIGGAGYQSSYGSAMEVCSYAAKVLRGPKGSCPCKL